MNNRYNSLELKKTSNNSRTQKANRINGNSILFNIYIYKGLNQMGLLYPINRFKTVKPLGFLLLLIKYIMFL